MQNLFLKAAQLWAQQTNINFSLVSDNAADWGTGNYQQGDPGYGDIRIGGYIFGSDLARKIRRTSATAWVSDPWARGSYSAARPGFARGRTTLATPVADRVFFAGEACPPTAYGAIHGAWLSGVDAAHRILATRRAS